MLQKTNTKKLHDRSNLLIDFFEGESRAWGTILDRKGEIRRKFFIDMKGVWEGERFALYEDFFFTDGEEDHRVWYMTFEDHGDTFKAECSDLIGDGKGFLGEDTFKMDYVFNLPVGNKHYAIRFDDRMYKINERTVANRSVMYKFGFKVGEINAIFRK